MFLTDKDKAFHRQNTKWLSHCIVVFPATLPFVAEKENEVGRDLWIAYLLLWCIWTSLNIVLTLFLILMVHISPYLTPFLQMIGVHISLKLPSAASSSSGGNFSGSAQVGFPNLQLCSSVNLTTSTQVVQMESFCRILHQTEMKIREVQMRQLGKVATLKFW